MKFIIGVVGIDVLISTLESLGYDMEKILKYVIKTSHILCKNHDTFDICECENARNDNYECKKKLKN